MVGGATSEVVEVVLEGRIKQTEQARGSKPVRSNPPPLFELLSWLLLMMSYYL